MAIVGEQSCHPIELGLCEVLAGVFLCAFSEMHDLPDSCPAERFLDGAVLDGAVLYDCVVHNVLSSEK